MKEFLKSGDIVRSTLFPFGYRDSSGRIVVDGKTRESRMVTYTDGRPAVETAAFDPTREHAEWVVEEASFSASHLVMGGRYTNDENRVLARRLTYLGEYDPDGELILFTQTFPDSYVDELIGHMRRYYERASKPIYPDVLDRKGWTDLLWEVRTRCTGGKLWLQWENETTNWVAGVAFGGNNFQVASQSISDAVRRLTAMLKVYLDPPVEPT